MSDQARLVDGPGGVEVAPAVSPLAPLTQPPNDATHASAAQNGSETSCVSIDRGTGETASSRSQRPRTQDVISDAASFTELMISAPLVRSLVAAGFERPSPVQKAAIPLGRVGADLIVQAKSGTGKTVVFAVICLERVKVDVNHTQALILAPTREIAIQSEAVIRTLASELPAPAPSSAAFVGGLPIVDDEKKLRRLVHIAVGTPGRVSALLEGGRLEGSRLSLLVLDEADSLLGDSFYEQVTWVYDQLPKRKQVLAFSATYTPELLADLEPLMKRPQRVMLCGQQGQEGQQGEGAGEGDTATSAAGQGAAAGGDGAGAAGAEKAAGTSGGVGLLGVRQFYAVVGAEKEGTGGGGSGQQRQGGEEQAGERGGLSVVAPDVFRAKVLGLLRLLGSVSFHQAAVFCNHKPRAEWLAAQLSAAGYPAAFLSGDRAQAERMKAMEDVRGFKLRVVVSTDVMARGVDLDRVNLVVNMDLPYDAPTYAHRVGRTGRFGSRGIAVSYVTPAELRVLLSYMDEVGLGGGGAAAAAGEGPGAADGVPALLPLPERIPEDLYSYELTSDWEREQLAGMVHKEREARKQLLLQQLQQRQQQVGDSGAAGEGQAGAGEQQAGQGTAGAGGGEGEGAGVDGGELADVLPELPPLPEETKAAKRGQAAAAAAVEELRPPHEQQQQQQDYYHTGQQGWPGYADAWQEWYRSQGYAQAGHGPLPSGGHNGNGYAAGYDGYGTYGPQWQGGYGYSYGNGFGSQGYGYPAAPPGVTDQAEAARLQAWAEYYAAQQGGYGGTGPYGQQFGSGQPYNGYEAASTGQGVEGMQRKARKGQQEAAAAAAGARAAQDGDGDADGGGSELSFDALRGVCVGRGRAAEQRVVLQQHAGSPQQQQQQQQGKEYGAEEDLDDGGWADGGGEEAYGEDDADVDELCGGEVDERLAALVDRLEVRLGPQQQQQQAGSEAAVGAGSARGKGCTGGGRGAAGAGTASGGVGKRTAPATAADAKTVTGHGALPDWTYYPGYGWQYVGNAEAGGSGSNSSDSSSGAAAQAGASQSAHGVAWNGASAYGPSGQQQHQPYPAYGARHSYPLPPQGPGYAAGSYGTQHPSYGCPYGAHAPYHPGMPTPGSQHYPPPRQHGQYSYGTDPYSYAAPYSDSQPPYGNWGAPAHGQMAANGSCTCVRCVRRVLRQYLSEHESWRRAYGAWQEQYSRWWYTHGSGEAGAGVGC